MAAIPDPIVGHEKQCGQLLSDIASRNISHAYLFIGHPHLGKFTIARWFAWQILMDGVPADEGQRAKTLVERLIHPDLLSLDTLWIKDVQEDWNMIGKSSNVAQQHRAKADSPPKTDTIGIKDIESLQGRLYETGLSPHLCCLIRSVERMSQEAANAFLKVLEEPPPRVVFLLTAESEHAVLPTIASRTRIVRFHPLTTDALRPLLREREDDDAAFALHLAQGAPGALTELLSNPDALRAKRQLHGQAKQFWQALTLLERLKWILPFSEANRDLSELLFHLGLTLRETPDTRRRGSFVKAYMALIRALQTNAHRGLLLERFALAVTVL